MACGCTRRPPRSGSSASRSGNVGKDGKLETVSDLSPDTPNYGAVLLTRETADEPKKPGTIILVGRMVTAADEQQSRRDLDDALDAGAELDDADDHDARP